MGDLFKFGLTQEFHDKQKDKKIFGVTSGTVISNMDCMGEGRVQLNLPWLPGYQPWARVVAPMAGMARGTYFIPQPGDEVLVAFNHGDVREPFVMGSLWNTVDRPPALIPTDPVTKRSIRTPLGQEVTFDEKLQSVTISNSTFNSMSLDLKGASLGTPAASITLGVDGSVTITGASAITLKAPSISIEGGKVSVKSVAGTRIDGGADCTIKAKIVNLNPPV
jgi:phage baseplate assembly protein gpV